MTIPVHASASNILGPHFAYSLFWHCAFLLDIILEVLFVLIYRCLQLERELAENLQSRISST
jgi:hypothetical protein